MFIVLPLRVEGAAVDRLPWVSISIAAACLLAFVVTWVAPQNPIGIEARSIERVAQYWADHPYLDLEPRFLGLLPEQAGHAYERLRGQAEHLRPVPLILANQQEHLDGLVSAVLAGADASLLRRHSLVPARGWPQWGLLTHFFLHLGWLHLLGNLLFFYVCGLLLEDRWGRPAFLGFYLLGGLVAGTAHLLLERGSEVMMLGASGAVAACMGAFAVRFPKEQIRFGYFIWLIYPWRGTFLMRAWFFGVLWFGLELAKFLMDDGSSGVALMAHLGGFAFGAIAAVSLGVSGLEARLIAPALERKTSAYLRPPGLDRADEALARGDLPAAQRELAAVLQAHPGREDAELAMARLEVRAGRTAPATARFERQLMRVFGQKHQEAVLAFAMQTHDFLDPAALKPTLAFRLAQSLPGAPEELRPFVEGLYAAVGAQGGALAPKALIRIAELRLDAGDAAQARAHLARARALPELSAEAQARIEDLERAARW